MLHFFQEVSEETLKNFRKSPKRKLTNNFVGSLIVYSKVRKQIWRMSHPLKGSVTVFAVLLVFWVQKS